jgi:cytochrome b
VEKTRILVWDVPVRIFHWLLALSFIGAFITADSERWRDVHVALGYTVIGLLAFRIIWAFVGSRYARLRSFWFGPRAVLTYVRSLLTLRPLRYVGHNPAGSWAIYGLVTLGLVTGASGYAYYNEMGGKWLEAIHEGAANAMLALVFAHVAGVAVSSVMHRENLVKSMLNGYKSGRPEERIRSPHWVTGLTLAAVVASLWTGIVHVPGLSAPTLATESSAPRAEGARVKALRYHGDRGG